DYGCTRWITGASRVRHPPESTGRYRLTGIQPLECLYGSVESADLDQWKTIRRGLDSGRAVALGNQEGLGARFTGRGQFERDATDLTDTPAGVDRPGAGDRVTGGQRSLLKLVDDGQRKHHSGRRAADILQGDIDVEGHCCLFVELDPDEAAGALGVRPFAQCHLDPTLLRLRRFPGLLGRVRIAERDRDSVPGLTTAQRTLHL